MSIRPVRGPVVDDDAALARPFLNAGVPANGVAGTGTYAGYAPKGALLIDTTNGKLYINGGDKTTVAWKLVTSA